MYYIIYLDVCYIKNSYIQFTKMLFDFGTFTNQTVLIYYIRISDMFESKNSTRFGHIYKSDRSDILYQNLICLNQKILLIFGTFMNQTVPIYCIRISDMFKSKNSTRFGHIYKSDCSDILYQNF